MGHSRRLLSRAVHPQSGSLVTTCPTYPGLASAFSSSRRRFVTVHSDSAGTDPSGIERASRPPGTIVYLMPTGHNPTGTVMTTVRRQAIAAIADVGQATVIEDVTVADLTLDTNLPPPPLAALSKQVVAVGSASKLLWSGLRVGWIRVDEPIRTVLIAHKAAASLATAALDQAVTAQLLAAIGPDWLASHRSALATRRDHLGDLLAAHLPAWRVQRPTAGLSLWVELPLANADTFAHVAARHGVNIAPGSTACIDGSHHQFVRLSFAQQLDTLDLAAERLAAAWEVHTQNLAAGPCPRHPGHEGIQPDLFSDALR